MYWFRIEIAIKYGIKSLILSLDFLRESNIGQLSRLAIMNFKYTGDLERNSERKNNKSPATSQYRHRRAALKIQANRYVQLSVRQSYLN